MQYVTRTTRRSIIKALGATAAAGFGFAWSSASGQVAAVRPGEFRILSCNIRVPLAVDDESGHGWEVRKQACAEILRAQQPDIVCLQECYRAPLEYLRRHLPTLDCYGLSPPEQPYHLANAILYSRERFELIAAGGFYLSETPHVAGSSSWNSARPRFANWVQLRELASDRQFQVWNTHLDHKGQRAREQQVQMLVDACRAYTDQVPQLLVGDFNADASNPAVQLVKDAGWKDTHTTVHGPQDPGFTFHRFLGPGYAEADGAKLDRGKIDWIFCRGPIETRAADVIRDHVDGRFPSDHYFLSATLRLRE